MRLLSYFDQPLVSLVLEVGPRGMILNLNIIYNNIIHVHNSLHEGVNSLTHAEVNHAPGSYVYSMGILYGANFNMADKTAGQLESALRVSNACAKAFEPRTS